MLENLYTTKMSADKKTLQNRFSKIRFAHTLSHKITALLMTVAVIITMLCANVVMAMVGNEKSEQFKIEVKHGNAVLQLDNKPFVCDNTVYLPLRELMEKAGLMEHESTYINWDNGKIEMVLTEKAPNAEENAEIKYLSYNYGIEIGKSEYLLNPDMEQMYRQKWNISNKKQMEHAPMLKEGVTYIPFVFVEYLVNRSMTVTEITCSAWDLAYNDSTERKADYINDSIGIEYADYCGNLIEAKGINTVFTYDVNTKNKSSVCNAFFEAFAKKDYEGMKKYCTNFCIENHFRNTDVPEFSNVFGYVTAFAKNISVPYTTNEKQQDILYVTAYFIVPLHSSAVSGEAVIKVFFEKQPDGTYLIDDFAH